MTLVDLRKAALEKLKIVAAGEAVEPEDDQFIARKYTAVYDMLKGKNLVAWASGDAVPDYAVIPLTNMLAWSASSEYGKNQNDFAVEGGIGLPMQSIAERQLREQLAKRYVSIPATSEYF